MTPANDSRLDALLDASLGALPREQAGEDFTAKVLKEVGTRDHRSQWRPLAAALALLAVGMGTYSWNEQRERREAVDRIAALHAEYEILQEELAGLENAKRDKGVVYLGGNGDVEFVLDLRRLVSEQLRPSSAGSASTGTAPSNAASSATVRPASVRAF